MGSVSHSFHLANVSTSPLTCLDSAAHFLSFRNGLYAVWTGMVNGLESAQSCTVTKRSEWGLYIYQQKDSHRLLEILRYFKFDPICLRSGLLMRVEKGIGVCSPSRLTLRGS